MNDLPQPNPTGAHELSTVQSARAAQTAIEARFTMALSRPRDVDEVRVRVLDACTRPRFAESALYALPVGGKTITGRSVRMADEAARLFGNLTTECVTVHDDRDKRILRCVVTDLETNVTLQQEFTVRKTVERSSAKNREEISVRTNSQGRNVYLVNATDAEQRISEESMFSRVRRNLILRLIPPAILDEAEDMCRKTIRDGADKAMADLDRLCDAFARLRVMPSDLAEYVGHPVAQSSPAEIQSLREIWTSIDAGDATWQQFLDSKREELAENGEAPPSDTEKAAKKIAKTIASKPVNGKAKPRKKKAEVNPEPPIKASPEAVIEVVSKPKPFIKSKKPDDQGDRYSIIHGATCLIPAQERVTYLDGAGITDEQIGNKTAPGDALDALIATLKEDGLIPTMDDLDAGFDGGEVDF